MGSQSMAGTMEGCEDRNSEGQDDCDDDDDGDDRSLDEDALEMDKSHDSQDAVDKQDSESDINILVLSTEDVLIDVCYITKKETEEENLGDEVLPLSFYDSDYNIEHEHNGFCV